APLSSAGRLGPVALGMGRRGSSRLWSSGIDQRSATGWNPHRPIREEVKLRLDCRKHRYRTRLNGARLWDQAARAISTGQLKALLPFHTRPINVVVCHDPSGRLTLREISSSGTFPA